MVNGEVIVEKLKDAKVMLKRGFGVKEIAFYGPHSRGEAKEGDEVNLLVTIDKPLGIRIVDLEEQLAALLENPVDITLKRDIEKKYLKTIRHELIYV